MRRSFHWKAYVPLAIALLAFGLRLYRLDNQSFAFDEGWTSYAIHHSWSGLLGVLAPDNHPPLYYVLVKSFADVAGYADFPVRFFSVGCGMVLVSILYALGKRLGGSGAGWAAALFAACSPLFVYYAQEARMYSLLIALAALASYSLVRLADGGSRRRWWAVYVLSTAGMLYSHYFAALLILTHNVLWLLWIVFSVRVGSALSVGIQGNRRSTPSATTGHWSSWLKAWLASQCAVLLLFVPWLPTAIRQVAIGQGTWWRMPLPASLVFKDMWRFFILGPRHPKGVPVLGSLMAASALVVLAALLLGWRRRWMAWAFALLLLALPVGLLVWVGSTWPIYTDRYSLVAAPGMALLMGFGVSASWYALPQRGAWLGRVAAGALLAAGVTGPLPQLAAYYHDPAYWREDFARAARYVMDKSVAGDTAVLLGCYQPIMQYYEGPAEVLRFPQRGDSVQDEQEVVSLLRQYVQPGHSVRLVMYSWPTVDPQGLVEGQLRTRCELRGEHWQQETGQRPIRVMNFASCDPDFVTEPRQPIQARWGDQVALSAYHIEPFAPGTQSQVVLWWRTLRQPDLDYTVFVHLLDAQGDIITQFDKLPLSDFYPMRVWPVGVEQRDAYPLYVSRDADLEGAWLAIGLYDRATRERLPVTQEGRPVGDFVRLPLP